MAKSYRQKFAREKETIRNHDGISDEDKELILEFLKANDPQSNTYTMQDGETKADSTLSRYGLSCRHVARDLENGLSGATAFEINDLMDRYIEGTIETVKDGGISAGSVKTRQSPLRVFYQYHEQLEVDPNEITLAEYDKKPVDERDMFSKEDVMKLRQTAAAFGTRDKCLIDILLYTGQRRSAILNLRLKDVDTAEGIFYLNGEDGDLKGASGKRPLLGALQSVKDWVAQHPTGEPDDYLITHKYDFSNDPRKTAGGRLESSSIYRQLQRIGKEAKVDKPVNAHNFRHYFVTVCKREYDMDDATVKHLIGHAPDSQVMETTYKHLTDDDYIADAERATGQREDTRESPLTPPTCDQCKEPLDGDWRTCPYCGYSYGPDQEKLENDAEEAVWKSKGKAETTEQETGVDQIRELLDDPEVMAVITEKMREEQTGNTDDEDGAAPPAV